MMRLSTLACLFVILTAATGFTAPSTTTKRSFVTSRQESVVGADASGERQSEPTPPVKCPNCDKCDGSGRILGGIPLILPWWPIKPYRPCPNFINNGGTYTRAGQGLDEIAFGRDSSFPGNK
jgi:hypothetical protein